MYVRCNYYAYTNIVLDIIYHPLGLQIIDMLITLISLTLGVAAALLVYIIGTYNYHRYSKHHDYLTEDDTDGIAAIVSLCFGVLVTILGYRIL